MNSITISLNGIAEEPWLEETEHFVLSVLTRLEKKNWDLSVLFCNNPAIKELNKRYRNIDEPTDVLSFSMGETIGERFIPGDIVISIEKVKEYAAEFNIPFMEELRRLLIHGILHLSGMDHKTVEKEEAMLVLQEKILLEKEHC